MTSSVMAVSYHRNRCLQMPCISHQGRVGLSVAFKYKCGFSKKSHFQVLACSSIEDKDFAHEKRIIYLGKPDGPTCHTGAETCYFSSISNASELPEVEKDILAMTTLYSLESTICERKAEISREREGKPTWTKKLLLDEKLLCSKIREEADELCQTLEENEDKFRAASEMADVLYHSMVLLAL